MIVELRCPVSPRRMFARWFSTGEATIVEGNLIEVACSECRRSARLLAGGEPTRVLHRYNVLGECVETEVVP